MDSVWPQITFGLAASSLCGVAFGLSLLLELARKRQPAEHKFATPAKSNIKHAGQAEGAPASQHRCQAPARPSAHPSTRPKRWVDYADDHRVSWTWSVQPAHRASQESPALEARASHRASQESPALEARASHRASQESPALEVRTDDAAAPPVLAPLELLDGSVARQLTCQSNHPLANSYLEREQEVLLRLQEDEFFRMYLSHPSKRQYRNGCLRMTYRLAPGTFCADELRTTQPRGVDGRQIAWMFNRLLEALGYVHRCGLSHNRLRLHHLWFDLQGHGVQIVGWQSATVARETTRRKDIADAAAAMLALLAADPRPGGGGPLATMLRTVQRGRVTGPGKRRLGWTSDTSILSDAWKLRGQWGALLRELYGEPQFIPFPGLVAPTSN